MGKFYDSIPESFIPWINEQHCFWVATAPLSADGHVNVSPKGHIGFGSDDSLGLPGRHTAMLAICWDDWENGGMEHLQRLIDRKA
ncbi:unnamed protein product [Rhizoctonia solani]|uniref:Uncharacterized protein n=1 Tax=Rhizoctonia solani TaxID=456999 RepID=A0A8H3BW45_9AGAM|nr:unnamed protein product [Rhizoctonia solani]